MKCGNLSDCIFISSRLKFRHIIKVAKNLKSFLYKLTYWISTTIKNILSSVQLNILCCLTAFWCLTTQENYSIHVRCSATLHLVNVKNWIEKIIPFRKTNTLLSRCTNSFISTSGVHCYCFVKRWAKYFTRKKFEWMNGWVSF